MAFSSMAWISKRVIVHIYHGRPAGPNLGRRCADRRRRPTVSWAGAGQGKSSAKNPELYSDPDTSLTHRHSKKPGIGGSTRIPRFSRKRGKNVTVPIELETTGLRNHRDITCHDLALNLDIPPLQDTSNLVKSRQPSGLGSLSLLRMQVVVELQSGFQNILFSAGTVMPCMPVQGGEFDAK